MMAEMILDTGRSVDDIEQQISTPELTLHSDLSGAPSGVKAEQDAVTYTISTDTGTAGTDATPSSDSHVSVTTAYAVGGSHMIPVMNVSPGGSTSASVNQATIPVMIQGVGGSGPVTLIYPAVMAPTSSTSSTSTGGATIVSQTDAVTLPSGIITVTPQTDAHMLPSSGTIMADLISQDSIELKHLPEAQKEMIDISELAATTSSVHSAITRQIVMELKSEASAALNDQAEDKASNSDSNLKSPTTTTTTTTGDESEDGMYTPRPKRSKSSSSMSKEEKICRVCGDRALGCNFDAISCESCKAFFRRNALKAKQPKCLFDGNCKIDINTRRFCPYCRLQKCFLVGMKKELILGEVEKKKRNEKVRMNREKRSGKCLPTTQVITSGADTLTSVAAPAVSVSSVLDATSVVQPAVGTITSNEVLVHRLTSQSPKHEAGAVPSVQSSSGVLGVGLTLGGMSFSVAGSSLPQVNVLPSAPPHTAPDVTNLLSLSKFAQKNEMSSGAQLDSYLVRRLTVDESNMLQELMQVYDLSFTVDLEPLIHIKHLDPSLNQLVNQSSITVLRLIKFAKRLEEFVRLTQQCQIGILKGTWIHILLLRSVSLYDSERDVWVTPKGDIPTEILKNATGFVKLHDDHVRYCKNIKMIIRDDLMIVVILLVIVLFSPEGPNVISRDLVSNIQDKYLILLKHYLESKYTYVRAAEMYPALMSKLKELKELAEIHGKYLLDVNPSEIEPIMLEILDLK